MNALGARMDARADAKASRTIQENAIEEVALACAVHAGHGDDSDRSLDVAQKLDCERVQFEF